MNFSTSLASASATAGDALLSTEREHPLDRERRASPVVAEAEARIDTREVSYKSKFSLLLFGAYTDTFGIINTIILLDC